MQGLWKTKVGGLDNKGNIRKRRQKRAKFLKDKGRAISRIYDIKKIKTDKNILFLISENIDTIFYYNKPVERWQQLSWYTYGKRKKLTLKFANRKSRHNIKKYLSNMNFEEDYKFLPIEKSISNLID